MLHFSEAGTVAAIAVEVDISHSYIGDLRVSLDSPAGTEVVLHGRTGGGTDNELCLELAFREREPTDRSVVAALRESVAFWAPYAKTGYN